MDDAQLSGKLSDCFDAMTVVMMHIRVIGSSACPLPSRHRTS